jgi:hypothetical protein
MKMGSLKVPRKEEEGRLLVEDQVAEKGRELNVPRKVGTHKTLA